MRIVALAETDPGEFRVAITPESVARLHRLGGASVVVQAGIGHSIHVPDAAYAEAGAGIATTAEEALRDAEVLLRVGPPTEAEIAATPRGCVRIGFLDPFGGPDAVHRMAAAGITAVSMELLPRTTLAQPMDALSSQHSLAGYAMVLLAAQRLDRVLPMMVTPSGTLKPATVLVIGAGVAGLQAIATARRLGAKVEAFDTRPATREQVASLGARFVEIDLGDGGGGETAGGYARELTDEQKRRQAEGLARHVAAADILITTAAVFGRPAPRIITAEMVAGMKPGSVVVDYAAAGGGNVDGTVPGEEILTDRGVRIIGLRNYPALVARDASAMYASNLSAFVGMFHRGDSVDASDAEGGVAIRSRCTVAEAAAAGDEIAAGSLVTHGGEIVHPLVRDRLGLPPRTAIAAEEPGEPGTGASRTGATGADS
jgi:NAD(P) transhydrogenase subunit alpha